MRLVSCGTYKTSLNTIDGSKVIFLDSHEYTITICKCNELFYGYFDIRIEELSLGKGVMWSVAPEWRIQTH